ncbi:Ileal sodium/bile acid cotransporter (Apical sodium-dependent bile acid transporter) (ASBT) (Ileal Na(+)/bile acid cotransporter) (Ileal sodium-dependent bile acid transporter) (IBAT) (ISBT) (Na(+)-dependent ileal bile acid transporter) (Sodium/taurocholate cotransporting polypeptide [Durusdinium trenchii]|uniref:Ileal (Solute carrier family 10 member 2 n=1 Tax=Durusdinium trenchii TaxID=1381693 RepID=A0ABP0KBC8_9DINO
MKKTWAALAFGAVLGHLSGPAAALTDKVRECDRRVCVNGTSADELELKCGGNGDKILAVRFASFGAPTGECPNVSDDFFDINEVEASLGKTAGCDATDSVQLVEDLCLGEVECTVDVSALFSVSSSGTLGCGPAFADRELLVLAECGTKFDFFQVVVSAVVAFISLGMGATVEVDMLKTIVRHHKRALFIGAASQFGFIPLISFLFVKVLDVDPLIAVGIMIIGSCPGGNSSNLMVFLAHGSVALSIAMTAFSTVLSFATLPLILFVYVEKGLGLSDEIEIPFLNVFLALLLAVVPASMGVYIRFRSVMWAKRVEKVGTAIGIAFILGAIILGVIDNPELIKFGSYPNVWIAGFLFHPLGCLLGYMLAFVARLPRPERRAVSLETGVQNTPLAIAIITLSFTGCARLTVLTYPLIASLMDVVNSALVAGVLRHSAKYDPVEDPKAAKSVAFGAEAL